MLTDWFTIAAQIVNFLILVWLLKRFLYGRIIAAIQAREDRIAASVREADAKEKAAAEQLALYEAKRAELEHEREAILNEARSTAAKLEAELVEKARAHAQAMETRWHEDLEREREAFFLELRSRAATEILAVAHRTVADLASLHVQDCAIETFLERLRRLDREAIERLRTSELTVRSAVELPEKLRAQIQQAVEQRLERPVSLHFEVAPRLALGIELRGNGYCIGWNAESYLESLEQDLKETLQHAHEEVP